MKILVTGCAGFIGFHLTRRLLAEGHEVVGVDDLNGYYDPTLKWARMRELGIDVTKLTRFGTRETSPDGRLSFVLGSVDKEPLYTWLLAGERFDAVCHLAAQAGVRWSIENPAAYTSANLDGFALMLEFCRNNNPDMKFVFASSSSVYGANAEIPYRENDRTDMPLSYYGATKKANEVMAYSYASLYGLDTVGLRFFTVYGPWGRPDMAPFIFTKAIMAGEPIKVFNNGDMSRDFTYIDDIVEGIYRILTRQAAGEGQFPTPNYRIYNIGNSSPVRLGDFISTIERLAGRQAEKEYLPMQPGDVPATWADTSLLARDYGYSPSTSLETGLAAFVEWYRKYYKA